MISYYRKPLNICINYCYFTSLHNTKGFLHDFLYNIQHNTKEIMRPFVSRNGRNLFYVTMYKHVFYRADPWKLWFVLTLSCFFFRRKNIYLF